MRDDLADVVLGNNVVEAGGQRRAEVAVGREGGWGRVCVCVYACISAPTYRNSNTPLPGIIQGLSKSSGAEKERPSNVSPIQFSPSCRNASSYLGGGGVFQTENRFGC